MLIEPWRSCRCRVAACHPYSRAALTRPGRRRVPGSCLGVQPTSRSWLSAMGLEAPMAELSTPSTRPKALSCARWSFTRVRRNLMPFRCWSLASYPNRTHGWWETPVGGSASGPGRRYEALLDRARAWPTTSERVAELIYSPFSAGFIDPSPARRILGINIGIVDSTSWGWAAPSTWSSSASHLRCWRRAPRIKLACNYWRPRRARKFRTTPSPQFDRLLR
jgi:hypothetical protein